MYDSSNYDHKMLKYDINSITDPHNKLNAAFKEIVNFQKYNVVDTKYSNKSLHYLFTQYDSGNTTHWDTIVLNNSIEKCINVFIMRTEESSGYRLIGFCPTLWDTPERYGELSPGYDGIGISFDGMFKYNSGATLIHEMGHFFGLKHPTETEMSWYELQYFGLDTEEKICTNYMNYNCFTNEWTPEQVEYMKWYLQKYRTYLLR
jgi:hypothetical protein